MIKSESISAVILAAGTSGRMKKNKTELRFDNKRTFFEKITSEYINFGCKEIIAVLNEENYNSLLKVISEIPSEIRIVINKHPENGRFYTLKTGVGELCETDFIFIQNIDNPFVSIRDLYILASNYDKADYIIPSFNKQGGHPVLISRKIADAVKAELTDDINIKTFLNNFEKKYIPTDNEKISVNINTVSDYNLYFNTIK